MKSIPTGKSHLFTKVLRRCAALLAVASLVAVLSFFWGTRGATPAFSEGGFQTSLPNGDYLYNSLANFPNSNACLLCHGWNGSQRLDSSAAGYFAATLRSFSSGIAWGGHPESALVDTDGDGFTNGEELQDPLGIWVAGGANAFGDQAFVANPNWNQRYPRPPIVTAMIGITNGQVLSSPVTIRPTLRYAGLSRVVYTFASASLTKVFTVSSPALTNYAAAYCLGAATAQPGACAPWDPAVLPNDLYTLTVTAFDKRLSGLGGPQASNKLTITNLTFYNAAWLPGAVGFSPTSVNFGSHVTNTVSTPQLVQVTNTGGQALTITSTSVSDYFNLTGANTCTDGLTLQGGQTCIVNLAFAPVFSGTITGTFTVTSTGATSPDQLSLSGTGRPPYPAAASLSTTQLDFGQRWIGLQGPAQPVTLTNSGELTLTVSGAAAGGPFAVTTDGCTGLPVGPGQTCLLYVSFIPVTTNLVTGTLTLTSNAATSPDQVTLTGTGRTPTPAAMQLSSTALAFGTQTISTTSAAQAVVITNTGALTLSVTGLSVTGDFALLGGSVCLGVDLPYQSACQMKLYFFPTAAGPLTGTLTISSTAASSPDQVALSGFSNQDYFVWLPLVRR